jgi:hypothetical protein
MERAKMQDNNGREWAKFHELTPGDEVECSGLTCVPDKAVATVKRDGGGMYISCNDGKHYLSGQLSDTDHESLIGLYHV